MQCSENRRKNSFLNYEIAALPAELRRHLPSKKFVDSNWLEVSYTCGDMSIGVWGYTTKRLCQLFKKSAS